MAGSKQIPPVKPAGASDVVKKGKNPRLKRVASVSRLIVDNRFVIGFTTFLTFLALFGDDLRKWLTLKAFDSTYNDLVLVVMIVFLVEIVLSSLGKDGYFLGFFFWLDLVSTVTMAFDLTYVNDVLFATSGSSGTGGNVRSGKTARVGAKAGRVIRVVRLVRILKLYKAIYEARQRKRAKALAIQRGEMVDEDWDDDDKALNEDMIENRNETQVGKKLSEMTTRRVIILILTMMMVLPVFTYIELDEALSLEIGADTVYAAFNQTLMGRLPNREYERTLLQYIYYHNWFAGKTDFCRNAGLKCSDGYQGQVFWVGMTGEEAYIKEFAAKANISRATVLDFNSRSDAAHDVIYSYGVMPSDARDILSSPWTLDCTDPDLNFHSRGFSLLSRSSGGLVHPLINCPVELRTSEYNLFVSRNGRAAQVGEWNFVFYLDLRDFIKTDSQFNCGVTLFIMFLLVVGSVMFTADANRLVVNPVEKMIKRVESIRANPLTAIKMADEEFRNEMLQKQRASYDRRPKCLRSKPTQPSETLVLEKTIIKLGSLLALGFGEAGANIVAQNMGGDDTAGVNAMVPGTRVTCIIGVARVSNFSTATEVLQVKIMTFVNQIAEIIHGVVNAHHGAPNKNNGDYFLVIWRLGPEDEMDEHFLKRAPSKLIANSVESPMVPINSLFTAPGSKHSVPDEAPPIWDSKRTVTQIADMSVIAFAQALGYICTSELLDDYCRHPGLQFRLGGDCRVNMTFGLHMGWAIEGAIGSEFKIDASYLSPNVSIAQSVEGCAAIYGVPLLMSDAIVKHCSPELVVEFRNIDNVTLSGSPNPIALYSLDLDTTDVEVVRSTPLGMVWNPRNRFKARQFLESEKASRLSGSYSPVETLQSDPILFALRARYTEKFFQTFSMGFQNYVLGEWKVAQKYFTSALDILGGKKKDGPTLAILHYMEQHLLEVPRDWQAVREISAKEFHEH